MNVVFFGTPLFAAHVLEYLLDHGINIVGVVSRPDKPKGRSQKLQPTPVKQLLQRRALEIPLFQPEKVSTEESVAALKALNPDLFVVVAYGEILRQAVLDTPKKGCINLHASLLPKYRGAAPIQRAVIDGENESGVTIIHMVRKMDAGGMIAKVSVPIGPNLTFGELEEKLCEVGSDLFFKVIQTFDVCGPQAEEQEEALVTFAPKIELEDCEIDWNLSAEEIHNLVRGTFPYPGAWCWVDVRGEKKRLKIKKTTVSDSLSGDVGEFLIQKGEPLAIACGKGALVIHELQLEGKKAMTGRDLLRGTPLKLMIGEL